MLPNTHSYKKKMYSTKMGGAYRKSWKSVLEKRPTYSNSTKISPAPVFNVFPASAKCAEKRTDSVPWMKCKYTNAERAVISTTPRTCVPME